MVEWKVGDWCYLEFELSQIADIEDGRVHNVSTGTLLKGSYDFNERIFPLDMKVKMISEEYYYHKMMLHKLKGNLNYPDIANWLEKQWIDCCKHKDDDEYIQKKYNELYEFVRNVKTGLEESKKLNVAGIRLFR